MKFLDRIYYRLFPDRLNKRDEQYLHQAVNNLNARIDSLKSFNSIDLSPPKKGDKVIYLPVEGTYNKNFFVRMYLLRNHMVANRIISPFDMLQYQIPVKATNEELILLIYGSHFLEELRNPEQLRKQIGKSRCENTDAMIMEFCPSLMIPNKVWKFRDEIPERCLAVFRSEDFKKHGEAVQRLEEWIKANFKLAASEYILTVNRSVKWVSEYKLYIHIKFLYPDAEYQYSPDWLGGQSLDIYIPDIKTGIEYQGQQHYEPLDYFGGEGRYEENLERDRKKAEKCNENGVKLYEWSYKTKITFSSVADLLKIKQSKAEKKLNEGVPFPVADILASTGTYARIRSRNRNEERIREHRERPMPPTVIRQYSFEGEFIEEYNTFNEASVKSGIAASGIQKCLAGQRKSAGEYMWRREDRNSVPTNIEPLVRQNRKEMSGQKATGEKQPVIQINPATGEVVACHESKKQAAKSVGIDVKGISDVINGKQKTAGGYYWQLADEYYE